MLMWYANLPEETVWYAFRMNPTWANVSWLMLFGHFVAPFFLLMSRHMKRRKPILAFGACWMLAMHWMDLYWIVMPQAFPDRLPFSIVDAALFLGMGGLFAASALRRLSSRALVPQKDPRLAESIRFENI
jgi:apolipoprotein N-acyltransferase